MLGLLLVWRAFSKRARLRGGAQPGTHRLYTVPRGDRHARNPLNEVAPYGEPLRDEGADARGRPLAVWQPARRDG